MKTWFEALGDSEKSNGVGIILVGVFATLLWSSMAMATVCNEYSGETAVFLCTGGKSERRAGIVEKSVDCEGLYIEALGSDDVSTLDRYVDTCGCEGGEFESGVLCRDAYEDAFESQSFIDLLQVVQSCGCQGVPVPQSEYVVPFDRVPLL